jgi:toxin ParE1/3/4
VSIDYTPHAIYDIDTISETLEAGRTGGGTRFQSELQTLLARLERFPDSSGLYDPPSPTFPNLRVARLSRFRHHAVFYQPTSDGILVVRVLHTSRNVDLIFNPDPDPPTPPGS